MKLRQFLIVMAGLAILVLSVIGMGALSEMKEPLATEEKPVVYKYVKTAPVRYTNVKTEVQAFGRVGTAQTLDMISEVSGRMFEGEVSLKEGQSFKKGQLLFKVDDEEAQLNLQSQKSNFLRDLAAILPDLKIDFSDNYPAWERYFNSISLNRPIPNLPKYKNSKEKTFLATKNIFSNFYDIKSQESRLKKHKFYAPFDGTIYSINLHNGSFVNAGSNIGRIIETNRLELAVDVNVSDIGWIETGTPAEVYAEDGTLWKGKVVRMGEFVNQETQSIDVFLAIEPNKNKLYDGQFLRAVMPSRVIDNSMIVPRNIIMNGDEVFTVEDTLLRVRKVHIHKINQETVVMSGLEEGKDLVIEPLINAFNGMPVRKLDDREKDIELEGEDSQTAITN